MQKTKRSDFILLFIMMALLAVGGISLSLFPSPQYAKAEKRNLAPFPTVSAAGLVDGSVCTKLDAYASERLPFRTPLRHLWGATQLCLGLRESHGVILCRDGSLCRRLQTSEQILCQNTTALCRLQALLGDTPLTVAVVPRRIEARAEVLPALYRTTEEQSTWSALPDTVLPLTDITGDADWFRTDHHWTQQGAYRAYCRLGAELGYTPLPSTCFWQESVFNAFFGSSASAAGLPGVSPDTVTLWRRDGDHSFRVLRDGKAADFTGLYDTQRLGTGDEYAVFLGGNCGVLEIDRGEGDSRPVLLVLRDSFASALLPFLSQHYRILAIDTRYCPAPGKYLERADLALCLFGLQTLTDTPLFSFLQRTPKA